MFKSWLACCVVVLSAVGIVSCGDSRPEGEKSGAVKIGLIVPGSTSDHGWNQLAGDSLAKLASDKGIEILTRQQVKKDDAADAIRQFDSKGVALVIAHGWEYLEAAKATTKSEKAPAVKVKVAVSGGDVDGADFQSIFYDLGPASYQLGVIAGKVSKSGKLGFIGGADYPTVTIMARGFEAGAKSVNPKVTVTVVYTNNWDDPAKSKQAAEGLIAQGVDVLMQNVDAASSGVFEAVKQENAKEIKSTEPRTFVYTFGANSDQNDNKICGDYTLASAVIKMDVAFARVIEHVKSNTFKGGLVKEDASSGVAVAVLNPKLMGKVIDAETQKLVETAGADLASGKVKIPEK